MRRFMVITVLSVLGSPFTTGLLADDAPAAEEARREVTPLRQLLDDSVKWYEFSSPTATERMTPRVVMRWANNIRGSDGGLTVLYLSSGIPQAVCSIYPWGPQLVHEFDSVSRSTIVGHREKVPVWMPNKPGLAFQPVPKAEAPAESAPQRLRQMKMLSAEFSSTMLGWKADSSDREALRLLPQPLYRYEPAAGSSCVDGAVFAFVQGTDPESLLLLEAVKHEGALRWEFAFVRQTSGELEGRHRETVVWHADRFPVSDQSQGIHFTVAVPMPVEVLESLKRKE